MEELPNNELKLPHLDSLHLADEIQDDMSNNLKEAEKKLTALVMRFNETPSGYSKSMIENLSEKYDKAVRKIHHDKFSYKMPSKLPHEIYVEEHGISPSDLSVEIKRDMKKVRMQRQSLRNSKKKSDEYKEQTYAKYEAESEKIIVEIKEHLNSTPKSEKEEETLIEKEEIREEKKPEVSLPTGNLRILMYCIENKKFDDVIDGLPAVKLTTLRKMGYDTKNLGTKGENVKDEEGNLVFALRKSQFEKFYKIMEAKRD